MPRILELVFNFHNCVSGGQQCDQTFAVGTLCRGLWPTYLALSRIGSHWSSGWSQQSIGSSKAPRNGRGHWHSIQITYKGRRNIMNQSKDKTTGIKVDLVNCTLFGKLEAWGFEIWRFFSSIYMYMLILLGDFKQLNLEFLYIFFYLLICITMNYIFYEFLNFRGVIPLRFYMFFFLHFTFSHF